MGTLGFRGPTATYHDPKPPIAGGVGAKAVRGFVTSSSVSTSIAALLGILGVAQAFRDATRMDSSGWNQTLRTLQTLAIPLLLSVFSCWLFLRIGQGLQRAAGRPLGGRRRAFLAAACIPLWPPSSSTPLVEREQCGGLGGCLPDGAGPCALLLAVPRTTDPPFPAAHLDRGTRRSRKSPGEENCGCATALGPSVVSPVSYAVTFALDRLAAGQLTEASCAPGLRRLGRSYRVR